MEKVRVFTVVNGNDENEFLYATDNEARYNKFVKMMQTKYPDVPIKLVVYVKHSMSKNLFKMLVENFGKEFKSTSFNW